MGEQNPVNPKKNTGVTARQAADKMLDVLKSILNEIDAYVYVSDMETNDILFVNRMIQENFDIGQDTEGKKCWSVLQTGQTGRCSFCPIFQLEKDPSTPVVWEEHNTRTGRVYRNVDSVIDWTDGRKVHMQYAIDITQTKAVQREADNMLGVLKNILNGMDAYVYVSDMATDEILFINNKMMDAFGLGEGVVGQICWRVLQDGFTERCSFCPNNSLAENPALPVIWDEHNTVTGRYYKNVDSVIEWMDGKQVHMQHSTDVTDILEAQNEIRKARERLEIALTSSQAGVWEMDMETNTLTYDEMCGFLLGLDITESRMQIDDLIFHLKQTLVSEDSGDVIAGLRARDPYSGRSSRDFHLVFADGCERHVRNYGNTNRNLEGRALRVTGMCIDITTQINMENDLKAAIDAAENASRAKSLFLSNMSHEIRTPMNAIIGMGDLLAGEPLNARQHQYVNDINISATSLLGIINDILDFSKIEAGKLQLNPTHYDLMRLLLNLESIFSHTAQSKGITFKMEIRSTLPHCLYGDDIRLRQVLVNIIGNAVKFTHTGGVVLGAYVDDGLLCFDVADTGIGIREEDLPRIFDDFDQLDPTKNRGVTGTGLGLSITKNLVFMMGGSISVESGYGTGTTFHLSMPLILGDETQLDSTVEQFSFVRAPNADILVVDDNEVNLNVATGLLGLCKARCDTAQSGIQAMEKIAAKHYDIVFMDHMMPEMDGLETTRRLRAGGHKDLVVIALTANAVEGAKQTLLDAGMDDYLSKPIDKAALNQILCKWLPQDKISPCDNTISPPPDESMAQVSPLFDRLAEIPGLDVGLALGRLNGMKNVYEKALEIMLRRLPEVPGKLGAMLEEENLKNFAIEVHGAKGSLGNIGATELAMQAEALEMYAKEGNKTFCTENLPRFLEGLLRLHFALSGAYEAGAQTPTASGNKELLREQLGSLRTLLDAFETDRALEVLELLAKYDFGNEDNTRVKDLARFVEEFDYDKALALL